MTTTLGSFYGLNPTGNSQCILILVYFSLEKTAYQQRSHKAKAYMLLPCYGTE